ncbi:hypothetical protein [Vreelandella populi]|uniref:hypothetical protein n=1 Tax=Vreelandella populi TaxID=2498858 RepID=UPI000F8F6274|nr:hypothetical protein [Halomonas populi]RUR52717.1 hypothetical protein ELY40_11750 [Halomonas populi]
MNYLDNNPRVAWAMAYESGIRTQATVDLAEMQEAQPKKPKYRKGEERREPVTATQDRVNKGGPGAAYGDIYTPIYAATKRMERETPTLAAVGHWLCLADTGAANQYLDDVAEAILALYVAKTPEWSGYRTARKERVEALIQARMMQDRNDMDHSRPLWQPKEVCFYCAEYMGVKIVSKNWIQDGWDKVWSLIGDILATLESQAMEPIYKVIKQTNKLYRMAA